LLGDSRDESADVSNILNNLDDDELLDNMSEDEEDDEETPELIAEVESREETIIEEFLEQAYSAKHEQVEALKASFRGNKDISKDDQKVRLKELQAKMDSLRKQGIK
jgi:hypothetical protein